MNKVCVVCRSGDRDSLQTFFLQHAYIIARFLTNVISPWSAVKPLAFGCPLAF